MNKSDLIAVVAHQSDLSKSAAERAVDVMLITIRRQLKKGGSITLMGFGSFKVVKRASRPGRNPKTGAEVTIKASKAVKFAPSKAMKESLN